MTMAYDEKAAANAKGEGGLLTHDGLTLSKDAWGKILDIKRSTLNLRIRKGMDVFREYDHWKRLLGIDLKAYLLADEILPADDAE